MTFGVLQFYKFTRGKGFSIETVPVFCMLLKHFIWLNKQRLRLLKSCLQLIVGLLNTLFLELRHFQRFVGKVTTRHDKNYRFSPMQTKQRQQIKQLKTIEINSFATQNRGNLQPIATRAERLTCLVAKRSDRSEQINSKALKTEQSNATMACIASAALYSISVVINACFTHALSPVSIQTQSLALRASRKRKPQETQAIAFEWKPGFISRRCKYKIRIDRETMKV